MKLKRFGRALLWESVQNLAAVCALVVAFRLWHTSIAWAVICAIIGGVTSAVAIALTEHKLDVDPEYQEPPLTMISNAVAITVGIIFVTLYQHAQWSDLGTDVLIGGALVGGLGIVQDVTGGRQLEWRHILSLTVTGAILLPATRIGTLLPWTIATIGLTLLMSTIVVLIEYEPLVGVNTKKNENKECEDDGTS